MTLINRRQLFVKRAIDVVGAGTILVLASPVIAGIAAASWLSSGPPVLFRQRRPGLHQEMFTMYKFRTMREPHEGEDIWTTDAERVTKLGAVLRRTSLDELPELVNVLRGEMSLVGPRPLLEQYLGKYSTKHSRRHLMKPGVTGLAQVSGRRRLTFSERLDLDVEYVDSWSILLDVKILLRTLGEPFRQGSQDDQRIDEVDDLGLFDAA